MGWNGSSNTVGRSVSDRRNQAIQKSNNLKILRGLFAGLVVIALGGVAVWLFVGRTPPLKEIEKSNSLDAITEVKPAVVTNETPKQIEKESHPGMVKVRGKWYPEYNKNGGKIWITKNWVRYHSPVVYTNKVGEARKRKEFKIFSNTADQDIALLLNTKPGAFRLGSREFTKNFEKAFLESLKTPNIVLHDDDEETAALKRAVIDTKAELKARYDAGEDIVKIMNDALEEQQQLALYRDELRQMVRNDSIETKGDAQATKDLYEAANKMLEERGLPPMKMPVLLRRRLELENINN